MVSRRTGPISPYTPVVYNNTLLMHCILFLFYNCISEFAMNTLMQIKLGIRPPFCTLTRRWHSAFFLLKTGMQLNANRWVINTQSNASHQMLKCIHKLMHKCMLGQLNIPPQVQLRTLNFFSSPRWTMPLRAHASTPPSSVEEENSVTQLRSQMLCRLYICYIMKTFNLKHFL